MEDNDYPALLKEIFDPPFMLFWRGNIECALKKSIAIVGITYKLSGSEDIIKDKLLNDDYTITPEKIAEDLGKDGQYIPGVRPGAETKTYISNVLNRITVLGALLLCFIALLPYIISMTTGLPQSAAVGGTGIIIVVGTAMEMVKTQKGLLINKQYKNFIGK